MMPEYHIFIGADHRGFETKEALFPILNDCHENVIVEDLGAFDYDKDDDFNDPAVAVAQAVINTENSLGVLLCASAHGVCMQANRLKGARAINATTPESARLGREDDHANILCLSADELEFESLEPIIKAFCHARPRTEERYTRRVRRLEADYSSTRGDMEESEEE